jgi:hypothetical protein
VSCPAYDGSRRGRGPRKWIGRYSGADASALDSDTHAAMQVVLVKAGDLNQLRQVHDA